MTRCAAALALAITGIGGVGCSADYPSIYIQQNQVADTGCVVSAGGSVFLSEGLLDTNDDPSGALNLGYVFTPLIVNAIAGVTTSPTLHLAFLTGADVEILPSGSARSQELVTALAAAGLAKHSIRFTATVKPGGSVAMVFHLTDFETTAAIRSQLSANEIVQTIVRVSVSANVDGGTVTSLPFEYPLSFCVGCLVQDLGDCSALPAGFSGAAGGVCNRLQDAPLQCCNNFSVCPAAAPAML